jgi:hypothetical protein
VNGCFLVARFEKQPFFVFYAQKSECNFYGLTVKKHIKNLENKELMLYNKNNVIALIC